MLAPCQRRFLLTSLDDAAPDNHNAEAFHVLRTDMPWAVDVVGYRLEEHWPKIQLFSGVEEDV